jgi:uncharacterized membrane protein YhaH (DUF805 family)
MDVWKWYVRQGRLSRQEWWLLYLLPSILLTILARWADHALGLSMTSTVTENGTVIGEPTGPLDELVGGLLFIPMISATVARLHDQGDSAWRLLLLLIPILGWLLLFVLVCFLSGGRLPNRYGPSPAPMRWPRLRRKPDRSEPPSETAQQLQAQGR